MYMLCVNLLLKTWIYILVYYYDVCKLIYYDRSTKFDSKSACCEELLRMKLETSSCFTVTHDYNFFLFSFSNPLSDVIIVLSRHWLKDHGKIIEWHSSYFSHLFLDSIIDSSYVNTPVFIRMFPCECYIKKQTVTLHIQRSKGNDR